MIHPILGLVGPSGSGKTALILAMRDTFPEKTVVLKSLTTRAPRDEQDALFYEFVGVEELRAREHAGRLVQVSEYAGNFYAHDREHIDHVIQQGIALCAIVEFGVLALRNAGYDIRTLKLIPFPPRHPREREDPSRLLADAKRVSLITQHDFELTNDFHEGGWETSVTRMAEIVRSL